MVDKCSRCGCELKVIGGKYVIEGDNNPNEKTRLFRVLTLKCPNCDTPPFDERIEQSIFVAEEEE